MNEVSKATSGIVGAEWLTPHNLEQGMQLANMMAACALVPDHLKKKPEDCFPILVQALRWRMDPFAVAQATSMVRGKLCFEGKLVHAVLVSMGAIEGRLSYEYSGTGRDRKIVVVGTPRGGKPCMIQGTVGQWATDNKMWKDDPDTMLAYRGARVWARLYCPDAMLGVATHEEIQDQETHETSATVVRSEIAKPEPVSVQQDPQEPVAHVASHGCVDALRDLYREIAKTDKKEAARLISAVCALEGAAGPGEIESKGADACERTLARVSILITKAGEPSEVDQEIQNMADMKAQGDSQ